MGNKLSCEPKAYSVLIIGLKGSGKTSIILRGKGIPYDKEEEHLHPTSVVQTPLRIGDKGVLSFTDLGGSEFQQRTWSAFYKECDALIWVVNISEDWLNVCRSLDKFCEVLSTKITVMEPSLTDNTKKEKRTSYAFKNKRVMILLNFHDEWMKTQGGRDLEGYSANIRMYISSTLPSRDAFPDKKALTFYTNGKTGWGIVSKEGKDGKGGALECLLDQLNEDHQSVTFQWLNTN